MNNKKLVIVESPSKVRTIKKYLDNSFEVVSSVGHIRDLATGSKGKKKSKYGSMGISTSSWDADYQVSEGKQKVVSELRKLAKECDEIFLATDLDREGEAIAWHITQILKKDDSAYKRVVFNEITKKSIQASFDKPTKLDMNKVNSQQARRFLDRVVGFEVSPILWRKLSKPGLSAGRVQSVALKLVVDREVEILRSVLQNDWKLNIKVTPKTAVDQEQSAFVMRMYKHEGSAANIRTDVKDPNQPQVITEAVNTTKEFGDRNELQVTDLSTIVRTAFAPPPLITASLQQEAAQRFGYKVRRTMSLAQNLYEKGFISYMRTDSVSLSEQFKEQSRVWISNTLGEKYVPEKPNVHKSKSQSQEAHEAIRPVDPNLTPSEYDKKATTQIDKDSSSLYKLIWERAIASQMEKTKYNLHRLIVKVDQFDFEIRGTTYIFKGYREISTAQVDEQEIPKLKIGDKLNLLSTDIEKKITRPKARFTEATLVKDLEKKGIGRPSTYAQIVETLFNREYVKSMNKNKLRANLLGFMVSDCLSQDFIDMMNFEFTAKFENKLDEIAMNKADWKEILSEFYTDLSSQKEKAAEHRFEERNVSTQIACLSCKSDTLTLIFGRFGFFLGVSDECREKGCATVKMKELKTPESDVDLLLESERCPKCSAVLSTFRLNENMGVKICSVFPRCTYNAETELETEELVTVDCDREECSGLLVRMAGRFGEFYKCDTCTNTRNAEKDGSIGPPKMDPIHIETLAVENADDYFILRDGKNGLFLSASKFPKIRKTRNVLVKELQDISEKLPKKYKYMTKAPKQDPNGNDATIMFDRKAKVLYVGSVGSNGKKTTWRLNYSDSEEWKAD